MHWLWHVLIGAAVGILARLIIPGKENMGWIMTLLLGIVGSVLAGVIGQYSGWYDTSGWSWPAFGVALVLAIILIGVYSWLKRKRT